MVIKLNEKNRDELVALLDEQKRLARALTKLDDPKWQTSVALTTDEDPESGEEDYIEFLFNNEVIKDILIARYNSVAESLRLLDIVVQSGVAFDGTKKNWEGE